jgi:hypothetical protein
MMSFPKMLDRFCSSSTDEFIAANIELALGSSNYKQQKTRRYHILQQLAWYPLLLILNSHLAAPAPAICKKPQGTISCLLVIAAKVQLALGCSTPTSCKKPQGITSCHNLPWVGFAIHDCPFQRRLTLHGICPGSSHNSNLA